MGPETITVTNPGPGPYTLFVHNYSAQEQGAESFKESGARVTVYGDSDQELARFAVPTNSDGFFWDVFSFDGATPQRLTPLQRVGNNRRNPAEEYTDEWGIGWKWFRNAAGGSYTEMVRHPLADLSSGQTAAWGLT